MKKIATLVLGLSLCMGSLLPISAKADTEVSTVITMASVGTSVSDNNPDTDNGSGMTPEPTGVQEAVEEPKPAEDREATDIITDVRAEFGSWSYPYDHTEKRSLYIITLSKPAHVVWDICTSSDGALFNSYEADFSAGENVIDWNGVNQEGEHPYGTVENPTRVFFQVLVRAESEDGMTDEKKAAFSFRFTHDFTAHKDYVEEHPVSTETPAPTEAPEEITADPEPTAILTPTPSTAPPVTAVPTASAAAAIGTAESSSTPVETAAVSAEPDLPKTADRGVPYGIYFLVLAVTGVGYIFSSIRRKGQ